jgi:hypothetical protein
MKIKVVKQASNRKPTGYCELYIDEVPLNAKK